LNAALKAAVLAAVVAALVVTVWHQVVTERLIDAAIELEGAAHVAEAEEPVVSRGAQRVGLGLALLLYGVSWALVLGAVFTLVQRWLPGGSLGWRATALVALAAWAFALLPFLKYPASPPGVGDPETIGARQALYLAVIVLGALGAVGALLLGHRLEGHGALGWLAALAAYAAYAALIFLALPPNPDSTPIPADLLAAFRLRTGLGLVLFWAVFAAAFGLLVGRWASPASVGRRPPIVREPSS
jgi:predicted cobalt transporter CbtA